MEIRKLLQVGSTEIEDDASKNLIRLIDLTTSSSFMQYGEVRLANADGRFSDTFKKGQFFSADFSLGSEPSRFFTGVVYEVFESTIVILKVRGNAEKLKTKPLKKSFNKVGAADVIRYCLEGTGLSYSLGNVAPVRRHTYLIAGGSANEEIIRANHFFGLGFAPWFDKDGKLVLKTSVQNKKKTDVEFNGKDFTRFENGILETFFIPELEVYSEFTILDQKYVANTHRIYVDGNKSKSIISVEKA